jgi:transposase InsO family protein
VGAVRASLQQFFERWGLPKRFRVDNGWPWASTGDLPPPLALWLWGAGCEIHWNRPAHPQENAKIERFNGLLDAWGEPEQCADWLTWTAQVDWVVQTQREVYPRADGQSRLQAHPELEQNPRRLAGDKALGWDVERVRRHLAKGQWRRQVDKVGQISLYHRTYGVGRAWAGQEVYVRYDAEANEWVIRDKKGEEIARHAALEITEERILSLEISHVKPHQRRPPERQNMAAHVVT